MKWYENLQNKIMKSNGSISQMQDIFYDFAKEIMNDHVLVINNIKIELTEIEFYYFDQNKHADPYVHTDSLQKDTSEYLYVHKQAWARGGVDLTFGDTFFSGGMLIRGIKAENKFISGSATVKKYISGLLNSDFSAHNELQNFFETSRKNIFLILNFNGDHKIYRSARIGLNPEKEERFCNALYRFAREDYLHAKKDDFLIGYNNLKDRTKFKLPNLTR